jgi:hypothetical protein
MADYIKRIVTTRRAEYTLNNPTNWTEVEKVFANIRRELSDKKLWDDTVSVEAHDDIILISYICED